MIEIQRQQAVSSAQRTYTTARLLIWIDGYLFSSDAKENYRSHLVS